MAYATATPIKNLFDQADLTNSAAQQFDLGKASGPMTAPVENKVQDTSLVSKQLSNILGQDSPYLQMARTRAAQTANARGLLNSSMAAGAGEAAAIERARPIAQQDADTYAQSARMNTESQNLFARDSNNFNREGALAKFNAFADTESQGRQFGFQRDERIGAQDFTAGENLLDRGFRRDERLNAQEFTAGENVLDRGFRRDERIGSQEFTSGENLTDRNFRRDEREDAQGFQREERFGAQDFQRAENTTNFARDLERIGFSSKLESARISEQHRYRIGEYAQQGVNVILADPTLTPDAKIGAINNLVSYTNSTLDWAEMFGTPGARIDANLLKTPGGTAGTGGTTLFPSLAPTEAAKLLADNKANGAPDNFDPVGYLEMNPDVADAVRRGQFSDAYHHFKIHGYRENRSWTPDRRKTIPEAQPRAPAAPAPIQPGPPTMDQGAPEGMELAPNLDDYGMPTYRPIQRGYQP